MASENSAQNSTGKLETMTITGHVKSELDKLWLEFHSGGITNPLTVVEQISYLMFARLLDVSETRNESRARTYEKRTGKKYDWTPVFPEDKKHIRWSHLVNLGASELYQVVQNELFAFFREELPQRSKLGTYFKDARCMIQKAQLMHSAVGTIDKLPILEGDTKGDLYEYLLSQLSTAGVAGQFRTPRHIIRAMVQMIGIDKDDVVCDPACGTGGFLTVAMDVLKEKYTSDDLKIQQFDDDNSPILDVHCKPVYHYHADQLTPYLDHVRKDMFFGFDFDSTMLRVSAMNMLLHGIDEPCIEYKDSLSETANVPGEYDGLFSKVYANPPFKGSIDGDNVHKHLTSTVKTKKTELLFLALIEKILKVGGKAAVIVPDGVLFGSSKAHKDIRKKLIENNALEAVVSLPSGVFKPYAGVSTAILIFTKGDITKNVWFYQLENDGYSLDDKRTAIDKDDLPDLVKQWREWEDIIKNNLDNSCFTDRKAKAFFIPKNEIIDNSYDLSINRYKEIVYEEVEYKDPKEIIAQIESIEKEIISDIAQLKEMIK